MWNETGITSRNSSCLLGLICLVAYAGTALAQNNSLFGQPTLPAPSSQPASGAADVLLSGPALPPEPAAPVSPDTKPPKNPVLLRTSMIAVPPPPVRRVKPHDLVTIIVREDKRSSSDARLNSEKKWELDSELAKWFRLDSHGNLTGQTFQAGPTPGAVFDFDNKYEGKGKVDRSDTLQMRITAEVIDVKPNGNLTFEATKTIKLDEETQVMTLTGTCRLIDLSPQNTILSSQIADLHIDAQHTGAARDAARRGWLMRFFDLIRPF